jgi:undecaprenyl diphosphate synthase
MHIGFIMDGNRRWAKSRMMPAVFGHKAGFESLKKILKWCGANEVSTVTLYAFSTENWARAEDEVVGLMDIFRLALKELRELGEKDLRVSIIGDRTRFASDIQASIKDIEESTQSNAGLHVVVALSYGGRAEILDAIRRIPPTELADITEEKFSNLLYTKSVPDPDLIIRTSGEQRLSNFLPWQSVYSELKFTTTLWPDFSPEELAGIISEFNSRQRRYGK